ncbi:DUF6233 domain-containing protein [Streptomyces sp. NPDC054904]
MSGRFGAAGEHWPIAVVLPDGQRLTVRLYERAQAREGPWMYRIGAPMWQCAGGPRVEAMQYTTWVSHDVLEPITGIDLSRVPTRRLHPDPPVVHSGWLRTPGPGGRGAILHDHGCRHAAPGGAQLDDLQALDELARTDVRACQDCDAAAVLGAVLDLGRRSG